MVSKQSLTKPETEDGAETIALVLSLPFIMLLFFCCIQLMLELLSSVVLVNEIEEASWHIDAASLDLSNDKDMLMKEAILENSFGINEERLMVDGTKIILANDSALSDITVDDSSLMLAEFETSTAIAQIESDVVYIIPSFLPSIGNEKKEVRRHLFQTRIVSSNEEIR